MAEPRRSWLHVLTTIIGVGIALSGLFQLSAELSLRGSFLAVLGFLIAGWAVLDHRRFRRGTPESEVEGGRTVE
jgi:hypothetical protein